MGRGKQRQRFSVRKNPKTGRYVKIDKRRNKIVSNTKRKPKRD